MPYLSVQDPESEVKLKVTVKTSDNLFSVSAVCVIVATSPAFAGQIKTLMTVGATPSASSD